MDFFRFLFTKRFLKHFAASVVIAVILIWIAMMMLGVYTKHGDYIMVPDFNGKLMDQLKSNSDYSDFDFIVIDSAYEMDKTKGSVLHQDPFPGSRVKKGRKVYLTIVSSVPEKTTMPDLKFLTLRQAVSVLESSGLKVGKLEYIRTFDEDAVQQQYFEGRVIQPGTIIQKGSAVNLVVGMGSKGQDIPGSGADSTRSDSM
jgi:eukaryotic-like serine/threonine-protein kinase